MIWKTLQISLKFHWVKFFQELSTQSSILEYWGVHLTPRRTFFFFFAMKEEGHSSFGSEEGYLHDGEGETLGHSKISHEILFSNKHF